MRPELLKIAEEIVARKMVRLKELEEEKELLLSRLTEIDELRGTAHEAN